MTLEAMWLEIRTHLERQKNQIVAEIRNYPPPIPACDLQFNHLLEERARVTQELSRLGEISEKGSNHSDAIRLFRQFIEACPYIDAALEAKLMSDLEAMQLKEGLAP